MLLGRKWKEICAVGKRGELPTSFKKNHVIIITATASTDENKIKSLQYEHK